MFDPHLNLLQQVDSSFQATYFVSITFCSRTYMYVAETVGEMCFLVLMLTLYHLLCCHCNFISQRPCYRFTSNTRFQANWVVSKLHQHSNQGMELTISKSRGNNPDFLIKVLLDFALFLGFGCNPVTTLFYYICILGVAMFKAVNHGDDMFYFVNQPSRRNVKIKSTYLLRPCKLF